MYIFTFSIFTMFFLICFVTSPFVSVTWSHGLEPWAHGASIKMLFIIIIIIITCSERHGRWLDTRFKKSITAVLAASYVILETRHCVSASA